MSKDQPIQICDRRQVGHYRIETILIKGGWARALGAYGLAIYNVLCCFADNTSRDAFPSYQKMADLIGCGRRTAIKSVAELARYNIISKQKRFGERGQRTNLITLLPHDCWRSPAEVEPESVSTAPTGSASETPPVSASAAPGEGAFPAPGVGASAAPELTPDSLTNPSLKEGGAVAPGARPAQKNGKMGRLGDGERSLSWELEKLSGAEVEDTAQTGKLAGSGGAKGRRLKQPAVEVYRRVTGRYPARGVEPLINDAGIETEEQLQFWEQVICRYIGCGWNRQNICAMLEFYGRRELPGSRPSSKKWGGVSANEKNCRNHSKSGYRFATLADFGLAPEDEDSEGSEAAGGLP